MKKVLLTLMCLAAMMLAGTSLKAQEVTVVLMPGWNWISVPSTDTLDFATALDSFTPAVGDIIQSQWGSASYLANGQWRGTISKFYPGYGYMYKSSRSIPVFLTFNVPQPTPQVVVTTSEPTDITTNSATCGGNVASSSGDYVFVFLKGVCWGTNPNPTFNDNYIEAGNGLGSFTVSLTELVTGSTYYVRAFAVTPTGTFYGEEEIFTTDHEFVDLGLPSGTLWATINVGANAPEEYGDYFAWGEISPKDYYDWSNYLHSINNGSTLIKYVYPSSYVQYQIIDSLTVLMPEDDAATANWGEDWRMPTKEEWQELYQSTSHEWTTQDGVNGMLFTAQNGNSIFLPAAGTYSQSGLNYEGDQGMYWSSNLVIDFVSSLAWCFRFMTDDYAMIYGQRQNGYPVRPVRPGVLNPSFNIDATANPAEGGVVSGGGSYFEGTECTLTATANEGYTFTNWTENDEVVSTNAIYAFTVNADRTLVANFTYNGGGDDHEYVDLGLPSGTLWATCNIGADTPEDYGDYFAWGEILPKTIYNWSTYQYCMSSSNTMTKYCNNSNYGYNGFTDTLTILLPEDDVAMVNWGNDWRMPTREEWQELLDNTTCTWMTQNGVNGRLFTANNGNSIFLPAAGKREGSSIYNVGSNCNYWSNSLYTDGPYDGWHFYFYSGGYSVNVAMRSNGLSVRAVRSSQNNAPTGAINGKFTINEDGDQVYFSQGNLQYQASTNTWKFAENQYDYVGNDNNNISSTYSGWIDLFGWGTSGYHDANDPYNVNYQPWSTSTSQVNSSYNYYGYAPSTNMPDPNLTGTSANYDWGVYNPISNGGNTANQWRTLTQPEWNYVFNTRSTTSGIRYAKAKVNNVNGVILLPDDWSTSTYSLSNTNSSGVSFGSNTITASQWSTLEQAGAVFLPAAGYRYGTSVSHVGSDGHYWSASCDDSRAARTVYFHDYGLYTDTNNSAYRFYGLPVRLVRVAEN